MEMILKLSMQIDNYKSLLRCVNKCQRNNSSPIFPHGRSITIFFVLIHRFCMSKHSQICLYKCGRNYFSLKHNQFLVLQIPYKETILRVLV